MRHAIFIERTQAPRITEEGKRVRRPNDTHTCIDGTLRRLMADGQVGTTVYLTVREGNAKGEMLEGASLICARSAHITELDEIFEMYQVNPDTGIGEVYIRPTTHELTGAPTHENANQIKQIAQDAVKDILGEKDAEMEALKAELEKLKAENAELQKPAEDGPQEESDIEEEPKPKPKAKAKAKAKAKKSSK